MSGPGGARCLRRPAEGGGKRVDDHFLLQPVISSRNHRIYFTQKWKIFCKMSLTYGLIFSFVSMSFITFFLFFFLSLQPVVTETIYSVGKDVYIWWPRGSQVLTLSAVFSPG